jgi:hypothetical protein
MNQINTDYIKNIEIELPELDTQTNIVNLIDNYFKMDTLANEQIKIYIDLKQKYIEKIINNHHYLTLNNICNISHISTKKNTIYINRNSNIAGYVNLTTTPSEETTNNYYLEIINNNFIFEYIYFILIFYEKDLIKLANNNKTISLNRKNLENFNIPLLSLDSQTNLISKVNMINNSISELEKYHHIFNKIGITNLF